MDKPSKLKIGFGFSFGGFCLAGALFLRPYDWESLFLFGIGFLFITSAAASFNKYFD